MAKTDNTTKQRRGQGGPAMSDDDFAAAAGQLIGENFRREREMRAKRVTRDAAQLARRRAETAASPVVDLAAFRMLGGRHDR